MLCPLCEMTGVSDVPQGAVVGGVVGGAAHHVL